MGRQLSIEAVAKAALRAIEKAHKDYISWSRGYWLWTAPEYLSTVYIAREIARHQTKPFVMLEHSPNEAIKAAGAKGRGKLPKEIRANGRFDILLCWHDEKPRAPIEVKGYVNSIKPLEKDLQRIHKILHRNKTKSSFQFGMIVFHTSWADPKAFSTKEQLQQWKKSIHSYTKEMVGSDCIVTLQHSKIMVDEDGSRIAMAIILKPNNR